MLRDKILFGALICVITPLMLILNPECPPGETPTPTAAATSSPSDTPPATAPPTSPVTTTPTRTPMPTRTRTPTPVSTAASTSIPTEGPTAAPTDVPTHVPLRPPNVTLGVNFWNDAVIDLFPTTGEGDEKAVIGGGYVLEFGCPDDKIEAILNAGLTPMLRFDYHEGTTAVPKGEAGLDEYKRRFTNCMDKTLPNRGTLVRDEVKLYIVGNEPALDNEGWTDKDNNPIAIPVDGYARAYAEVWKWVHGGDGTERDVRLLACGEAPHQARTISWLTDVTNHVLNEGADVDGYAIHINGFGLEFDSRVNPNAELLWNTRPPGARSECSAPWNPLEDCDQIGGGWPGDDGFQVLDDQLGAIPSTHADRPVYITEFNTGAWGTGPGDVPELVCDYQADSDCAYTPMNNYPHQDLNWIVSAGHAVQSSRVRGMLWFVGDPHGDWGQFSLLSEKGRLPCAYQDFRYVTGARTIDQGPSGPKCEGPYQGLRPQGGAAVARNESGQPVGVDVWAYDEYYGLQSLDASCGLTTAHTAAYDLSETEAGRYYAGTVDLVVPQGYTCTLELSNKGGYAITQTLLFSTAYYGGGPGGDHPDESLSAASSSVRREDFVALSSKVQDSSQMAVLPPTTDGEKREAAIRSGNPGILADLGAIPVAAVRWFLVQDTVTVAGIMMILFAAVTLFSRYRSSALSGALLRPPITSLSDLMSHPAWPYVTFLGVLAVVIALSSIASAAGHSPVLRAPSGSAPAIDISDPTGSAFTPPSGSRTPPRVAIMQRGAAHEMWQMAFQLGELSTFVDMGFDPVETVRDYPVLLIPSGGLYGLDSAPSFQARLETYARAGGIIIAFDQQHGYEYGALPGGQVSGYGWHEDISCSGASLMMETWHPMLSGLNRAAVYAHVDGFFDSWPSEAQVILSRRANGRPAAILYPYGEGWVFATTIYDDWGSGHGQSYQDARILLRDLLSWAIDEEGSADLPQYAPGDSVTLSIPMTNTSPYTTTFATLRLVDPTRQLVLTQTTSVVIPPQASGSVPFVTSAGTMLGIWRVDGLLLYANGYPLVDRHQVSRYVVAQPPAAVEPGQPLFLSITAPTVEYYSDLPFTFHVYNYGDQPLVADLYWALDHQRYHLLADDLVVPAAQGDAPGKVAVPFQHKLEGNELVWRGHRLRGRVYAGDYSASAAFGFRLGGGMSGVLYIDPPEVQRGETATLTIRRFDDSSLPVTNTFHIRAVDSGMVIYHTDVFTAVAQPDGPYRWFTHTFTVPAHVSPGSGLVSARAELADGSLSGVKFIRLSVPASPLAFSLSPPPPLAEEATVALTLAVTNTSPSLAVDQGTIDLELEPPVGDSQDAYRAFSLPPSSASSFTLPLTLPPATFGPYVVTVEMADEYGDLYHEVVWRTRPLVEGTLGQATYSAREEAHLDLRLVNPGPMVLPLTVALSSDLPYATAGFITLQPYESVAFSYDIPIPSDVTGSTYPLTVRLTLPGGDSSVQVPVSIQVPPSELTISSDVSSAVVPGETIVVTLANIGGADTTVDYDLRVVDARGYGVISATVSALSLHTGQSITVPLALPAQMVTGPYTVLCTARDRVTGEEETLFAPLTVDGLEASLDVFTDRDTYLTTDVMTATGTTVNGTQPLGGGTLTLRVAQPAGTYRAAELDLTSYTTTNSGISTDQVQSFAFDGQGNVYFATAPVYDYDLGEHVDGGVSVLQSTGEWNTFTTENTAGGLVSNWVSHVATDQEGTLWAATNWYGLSMRTPEGEWQTFASPPLPNLAIHDMVVDAEGNVWVGTDGGLSVRWAVDGSWTTYTTADGLITNRVVAVEVDTLGNVWSGHAWSGASVRLVDGSWTTYTTADGLGGGAWSIAAAGNGDVYIGHDEDQNVISIHRADGSWETIPATDVDFYSVGNLAVDDEMNIWVGDGNGAYVRSAADGAWRRYAHADGLGGDNVTEVVSAPDGTVWLATFPNPDSGYPGGATAVRGPLVVLTPWQSYTEPFDIGYVGYGEPVELTGMTVDPSGNRWFAGGVEGEGYEAYLFRLSADGEMWDVFHAGYREVNGLAVDSAGTVWLALGDEVRARDIHGGWAEYTSGSTGGGLLPGRTASVAVDAEDRVWFTVEPEPQWDPITNQYVSVGGGVSVLSGTTWITFTAESSDLPSNRVGSAVAGDAGGVWVTVWQEEGPWETTGDGVATFSGTSWMTYTTGNSGLYSDVVTAIAVDEQANTWFGHWNALSLRRADGTWATYTDADGLPECSITTLAVGRDGKVWLGCDDQGTLVPGVFAFSPDSGEAVQHTVASTYGGLVSNAVIDMAIDNLGDVWVVGGEYYDEDLDRWIHDPGASRHTGLTRVFWETTTPVDLAGGATHLETAALSVSDLGVTGRLYLEGELETVTGQRLAFDRQPFTVYEALAPSLGLGLTPDIVAPGENVAVEVSLRNGNPLPLTGQEITVKIGTEVVAVLAAPEIPAGNTWTSTVIATAPDGEGAFWVEASDGVCTVRDRLAVSAPTLDVSIEALDVAGREPFDLVLLLENPSLHDLDVEVAIEASDPGISGLRSPVSVPAGETRSLLQSYAIAVDTTFTVTISGDVNHTVWHTVAYGEKVEVGFEPEAIYPEGPIAIPYDAGNTGLLPVEFTTVVTVQSPITSFQASLHIYLPVDEAVSGSLLFDLPADDYTLTYATFIGTDQGVLIEPDEASFRVVTGRDAELSAWVSHREGNELVTGVWRKSVLG
jgi:hypothetical protein